MPIRTAPEMPQQRAPGLQNGTFAESVVLCVLGFCAQDAQNARTEARGIGKVGGSYLGVQNGLSWRAGWLAGWLAGWPTCHMQDARCNTVRKKHNCQTTHGFQLASVRGSISVAHLMAMSQHVMELPLARSALLLLLLLQSSN